METHRYYSKWRQNQTSANPQLSRLYGLSRNHTACGMGMPLSIFYIMWAQVSRALDALEKGLGGSKPTRVLCGSPDSPPEGSGHLSGAQPPSGWVRGCLTRAPLPAEGSGAKPGKVRIGNKGCPQPPFPDLEMRWKRGGISFT